MIIQSISAKGKLASSLDDFEAWLGERHKWLQTAAHRLIDSKAHPTESELAELGSLCLGEASGHEALPFAAVVPGSIVKAATRPTLHINGLHEVRGVNKIKDRATLTFGKGNLTVVYGANGSGKTGFARVLKQACGSRTKEDIHPNVFEKMSPACEAKISVSIDKASHDLDWSLNGGPLQLLRHVHVFDSKAAANYLVAPNEAHYAPSRMRFVLSLIRTCDRVAEHLTRQKDALVKKLPEVPADLMHSRAAKWLLGLRSSTSQAAIDQACDYTQELDEERIAAEGALAQKDIGGRLEAIGRERANVVQVNTTMNSLKERLSDAELGLLLSARSDALGKRKAASEAAEKVFANAPLEGVGQKTWMALWEQARNFSQAHAYPGQLFPNVEANSRCVLCQQVLDDHGRNRFTHFEAFVVGGLEEAAKAAEKQYADLLGKLPTLPLAKDWALQTSLIKLDEARANELFASILARNAAAETMTKMVEIPQIDWAAIDEAHIKVSEALNGEDKALKELQQDGNRKQLESRVVELRAMQWLSQIKVAICEEVARLTKLALLDKAIGLTNTAILTRKNTDLARDELHRGYKDRFAQELKALGGKRLPVAPESKQVGKGKVTFRLTLQGVERALAAEQVLSEGETRIVALAAFLADISGSGNPTPFIFDDPISSLDQDFEEKVVKRLIELAKTRQVIVFTHRLSLLALIESEAKKLKNEADLAQVPSTVELHIESVCSFGKRAGVVQEISIRDLKPKPAINRMRNEQLKQLRNLHAAGDVAGYDERANALCSDLRILVERCVESVLLNDVLIRFRRAVQTQGKIGALAKITTGDCSLIDDLMTRYSVFEHSQSDEFPAARPEIEDIEADVLRLATWIDDFSKRAIA
jgi:energy-coupling factor transporter ATP-binding protein EcfA2